jgi:hypothetical protein
MKGQHGRPAEPTCTPEIVDALDDIIGWVTSVDDDDPDTDAIFAGKASNFFDLYWAEIETRGLNRPPQNWPPPPALVVLEAEFAVNQSLPDEQRKDYVAAVKLVRDYIVWRQQQQASMN